MSNTCNRCGAAIVWPQPYQQGAKPLNSDGATVHSCGGAAPQQQEPAAPPPQQVNLPTQATSSQVDYGRTESEKTEDARHMIEILWGMASHKALEVIPKGGEGESEAFADNGQRLILAEVFYKSLTYSWVRN